jgi:hypothetical protein
MKIIRKSTLAALSMVFLLVCNFCAVECAFSFNELGDTSKINNATESHPGCKGHGEKNDTEKSDDTSLCCDSLVADNVISGNFSSPKLIREPFFKIVDFEGIIPKLNHSSKYQTEYPPGVSPPLVFLSNHLTHAPPALL